MSDWQEIVGIIERLQRDIADLSIRGLRVVGPQHLASLESVRDELSRINAIYLANQIGGLVAAIQNDEPTAARQLLQSQTTLRLFERLVTQEAVSESLQGLIEDQEGEGA
jgi:hypothetical protein